MNTSSSRSKQNLWHVILYYGTFAYLLTHIIEGALRYFLYNHGAEKLIYWKDAFLILAVSVTCIKDTIRARLSRPLWGFLVIILIWGFVGWIHYKNIAQTLFGMKIFMAIALGIIMSPFIAKNSKTNNFLMWSFWIIAITGLFISYFVEFPWEGFQYSVGDIDVTVGRQWFMDSYIRRPGGFERASFGVGAEIILLGAFLYCFSKNNFFKTIMWLLTGIGVVITTSRSIMMGYAAISLFWMIFFISKSQRLSKILMILIFAIMILLPILAIQESSFLNIGTSGGLMSSSSLADRSQWEWPNAFDLLLKRANIFTGRGVGGIGAAQQYFEPVGIYERENAADNLFIYLLVSFGLFSLVLLFSYLSRFISLNLQQSAQAMFIFGIGLVVFSIGITLNVIESPFLSFFTGITIEKLFSKHFTSLRKS